MKRAFDEELAHLKRELMRMSALAETMINDAIKVLVNRDESVGATIRRHEDMVNRMQVEIDEKCLELIALHQPAARDLRFIMGAAKTNSELERLADQAVSMLNKAEQLLKEPPLKDPVIIPKMAAIASEMLRDSLHAFVNNDTEKARLVLMRDDELDDMKRDITQELAVFMAKDSDSISRALKLVLLVRSLERIGDHATNIAENAIFVAEGRDVRHHLADKPKSTH